MQLVLSGTAGTHTCAWGAFALLRDNVQHYLEGGQPSARFRALHAVESVLDNGKREIDAARLRGEVLRAWGALWRIDVANAAISLRTRAVVTGCHDLPESRATVPARGAGWALPLSADDLTPVPQAAADFVAIALALTENAVDGDALRVSLLGRRPILGQEAREQRVRAAVAQ